jgi:hypothetical protein
MSILCFSYFRVELFLELVVACCKEEAVHWSVYLRFSFALVIDQSDIAPLMRKFDTGCLDCLFHVSIKDI